MTIGRGALAWGLAVLSGTVTLTALAVGMADGLGPDELVDGATGLQALMAITFPVLGALLLTRSPGNRLAAVFSATGLSRALALLAHYGALHDYRGAGGWPFPAEMAFLALAMTFVAPVLAPLLLLWFPDGRLPDGRRRWRIAQRAVLVSAAGVLVLLSQAWSLRGPAMIEDSPTSGRGAVGLAIFAVGAVIGVLIGFASVLSRLRGQDQVVRQQVKWYLYGALAAFVLNIAGDTVAHVGFLNLLGTLAFEAAGLVAVWRYALWDIDRILNRTVVYGLLTVTVAAVYGGAVLGLGLLLGQVRLGHGLSIAAGTLAATVIAGPARREFQARVDRRFDRRGYDALHRVRAYGEGLALTPPVPGDLALLLGDVLRDPDLRLLFRCQGGLLVDAWGQAAVAPAGGTSFPSATGELALLVHRDFAPYERAFFGSVHECAAGAVALARLHAEVLVQVKLVEESRRRIVEAAEAERRRVERDLHDGAQQRLVALAMTLRSEQRQQQSRLGPEAVRIIDLGVSEIRASVEDLRLLAAGLVPGSLVSEGLGPALRELADRQPDPVLCVRRLDHRHPPEIEATAWFVAAEGLSNCLKHAPGSRISIEALCDGHGLQVVVMDDGPGGAGRGPGLTGLEDRVRACAGTLDVHSPLGSGTRLTAMLPCG